MYIKHKEGLFCLSVLLYHCLKVMSKTTKGHFFYVFRKRLPIVQHHKTNILPVYNGSTFVLWHWGIIFLKGKQEKYFIFCTFCFKKVIGFFLFI